MQINFLNQYYKNKSLDQNASDLVNLYLEEDQNNGKYSKVIALPTPGLAVFNSGSGSVVRATIEHRGIFYAIVDNKFYSYNSSGVRTEIGTLNTSSGSVRIASIINQIQFVDGTDQYNYNTGTLVFTVVSDIDRPTNPVSITSEDSFFLVSCLNSSLVYASDVADGTSWNALSFNTKKGQGDFVKAVVSAKSLIYVLGDYESDVWQDSGAATFSFEPIGPGSFIHYGCAAKESVAVGRNTLFFLAQSRAGGTQVVMMQQYEPQVVSNRAIDYQISQMTTISDATAYVYYKSGHEFYVITFPTTGVTFSFDVSTGIWNNLQSYVSSAYTRHLGNCYSFCYGKHLVGAYNSGTIYYYDDNTYTDNGAQILRRLTTPPAYAEGNKIFLDRLQIDMENEVGSSLAVTLDISYDSGHNFTTSYTGTIPSAGGRLYWTRLGYTQNAFVLRFSTTVAAKVILLGAQAEIRKGIH